MLPVEEAADVVGEFHAVAVADLVLAVVVGEHVAVEMAEHLGQVVFEVEPERRAVDAEEIEVALEVNALGLGLAQGGEHIQRGFEDRAVVAVEGGLDALDGGGAAHLARQFRPGEGGHAAELHRVAQRDERVIGLAVGLGLLLLVEGDLLGSDVERRLGEFRRGQLGVLAGPAGGGVLAEHLGADVDGDLPFEVVGVEHGVEDDRLVELLVVIHARGADGHFAVGADDVVFEVDARDVLGAGLAGQELGVGGALVRPDEDDAVLRGDRHAGFAGLRVVLVDDRDMARQDDRALLWA